jgi:hypothetical protein
MCSLDFLEILVLRIHLQFNNKHFLYSLLSFFPFILSSGPGATTNANGQKVLHQVEERKCMRSIISTICMAVDPFHLTPLIHPFLSLHMLLLHTQSLLSKWSRGHFRQAILHCPLHMTQTPHRWRRLWCLPALTHQPITLLSSLSHAWIK